MARKSVSAQVANNIIDYVRKNRMMSGQHLPAQVLADTFKVSRAPVAAALSSLYHDGLVELEANRGYFLKRNWSEIDARPDDDDTPGVEDDPIYFRIAQDRLDGSLAIRVTENELMRSYGVPRGRLVKILHTIRDEGWIERLPGNGWEFTEVLSSPDRYQESYAFRASIERDALLLPTFRVRADLLERERSQQKALIADGYKNWSSAKVFKVNNDFHEMLVGSSGNTFFLDALRRVNRLRRLIEYKITLDRSRLPDQAADHLKILDMLEAGKIEEAAQFLHAHILGASAIKSKLLRG